MLKSFRSTVAMTSPSSQRRTGGMPLWSDPDEFIIQSMRITRDGPSSISEARTQWREAE